MEQLTTRSHEWIVRNLCVGLVLAARLWMEGSVCRASDGDGWMDVRRFLNLRAW